MEDDYETVSSGASIRAKRLAKMGGSSTGIAASGSAGSITDTQPSAVSLPASSGFGVETGPANASGSTSALKPVVSSAVQNQSQPKPKPKSTTATSPSPATSSVAPSPSAANAKAVALFLNASAESWEHQTMAFIFNVELESAAATSKGFIYLDSLANELRTEGSKVTLTSNNIDRILYARLSRPENAAASSPTNPPLFDYLVSCWKRSREAHRRVNVVVSEKAPAARLPKDDIEKLNALAQERISILISTKELIVSYSGLVVNPELAEMYPQPAEVVNQGASYIASKLLLDVYASEDELPTEFLKEFIARFENDGLNEIISAVINSITAAMRLRDITIDYTTPLRALTTLISYKEISSILISMPNFLPPNIPARTFEILTILGPFFAKPAVFNDETGKISQTYFASANPLSENSNTDREGQSIGERNYGDVQSVTENLRGTISTVQSALHGLVMTLVKNGPEYRESILKFLSAAISLNYGRGRMQVDPKTVATDGFLYNIGKVCLQLCEPITELTFSKVHLIEPYHFLRPAPRLPQPPSTTMMNADDEFLNIQRQKWVTDNPNAPAANFVTDVFVLALGSLHLGYTSTARSFQDLIKRIGEIKKEIDRMKAERDGGGWANAPDKAMREFTLKRYQTQLDVWISHRLVLATSLLDKTTVDQIMRFYNLVMVWLIRVILVGSGKKVDGVNWAQLARGNYQGVDAVPFPADVPALFATLPEWIFEDIVEFYVFICRFKPTLFENTLRDEFMIFSVAMLQSSGYIKNPHLKSKLVEVYYVLYYFTLPLYRTQTGEPTGPRLDMIFSTHDAAKLYLVPGIMRFYVDAEFTGASSAFYDKFNIRYHISQILKAVWEDQNHRIALIKESRKEEFIKFANLLMNDTSYLLDESLGKLSDIHKLQDEMDDIETWNALDQAARDEKLKYLSTYENAARSYVMLCTETVNMFQYLTSDEKIVTPFMAPYIVERLAAMLDYNLTTLVGPKCTDLKVKNPEKYGFDAKKLLTKLVDIFVNLAHRSEFVQAVAKDERSYKKDIFTRAVDILSRYGLKNSRDLETIKGFVQKVEEVIRNTQVEDEELGDVPDDFLDPLLASLMEDPVILPTSGVTVDRSTIITQLLSQPRDPFNRKPLTIDM
ncbi:hypothetical protein HK100_001231, partial [Physocladia obscura]